MHGHAYMHQARPMLVACTAIYRVMCEAPIITAEHVFKCLPLNGLKKNVSIYFISWPIMYLVFFYFDSSFILPQPWNNFIPSVYQNTGIRMLRKRRSTLKSVKEFDAFPKVPESYTKNTSTGGTSKLLLKIIAVDT